MVDATRSGVALTIEPTAHPSSLASGLSRLSFVEHTDWTTGEQAFLTLEIGAPPQALFARVFGAGAVRRH